MIGMGTTKTLARGVDPGSTSGAWAELEGGDRVVAWGCWLKLDRKAGVVYRVQTWMRGAGPPKVEELPELGAALRRCVGASYGAMPTSVEGLFIGRRDGSIKLNDQIKLAESAGMLLALLDQRITYLYRPFSRDWRPRQAGIPAKTKKGPAEQMAVDRALAYLGLQATETLTKAEVGAVAEAAWMAQYAHVQARYEP